MNILFISDNFPPEVNAPATRTYEHCKEWVAEGHNVTVITCFPNFPQGKVYDGFKNHRKQVDYVDGIKVVRVWSYIASNKGFAKRLLDFMSFALSASWFGIFEKSDVIIATSPQFFTTWSGWFLSKVKRKPWIFELRDLWPESIASLGVMKKNKIYSLLESIELALYRSSTIVIPNTDSFKVNLVERGIDSQKIHVIKNGANLELFSDVNKPLRLREELDIVDKFIVGYIGTHGMAHSLDFVVRSIANNRSVLDHCHFIFIGDGAEKDNVKRLSEEAGIPNITFLDSIPKNEIPEYMLNIDVSLVPLKKSDTFKTVIPSKIFEACAMGIPILLGVEGESKKLIQEFDAGLCFEPENEKEFIDSVVKISSDKSLLSSLSGSAKKLAKSFDRKILAKEMLEKLKEIDNR